MSFKRSATHRKAQAWLLLLLLEVRKGLDQAQNQCKERQDKDHAREGIGNAQRGLVVGLVF